MKSVVKTKEQLLDENKLLRAKITELEKNREISQIIAENTSDNIAITSFDLKAKYLYVSPSVKHVLGYDPEELIGKSFFDFIHPNDKKALLPLLKKYLGLIINKVLHIEDPQIKETISFRFRNKSGNWRIMESTINFIGKNLLAVTRDITERKKAEEESRKFTKIIETTKQSVIITDIEGQVLYVNPSYYAYSGFKPKEVIGQHMFGFTTDFGAGKLQNEIIPALFKDGNWQGEMEVIKKNKKIFPISLICSLLSDENNNPECFVALFTDISNKKKADAELQKYRNRLEELVDERTKKIEDQKDELERFNKLFVGREFRIKELKDELSRYQNKFGVLD